MCDNSPSSSTSSVGERTNPGGCQSTLRTSFEAQAPKQHLRQFVKTAGKKIKENLGIRESAKRGDVFVATQSGSAVNAPYQNSPVPHGFSYSRAPYPSGHPPQPPNTRPPSFPPRNTGYGWNLEPFTDLSIETMGGETAGSGYGYLQQPHPPPYPMNDSMLPGYDQEMSTSTMNNPIKRAQVAAINVVKAQIEQVKQELQDVSNDSREIAEFIPTAYDYEIGMVTDPRQLTALDREIADLERKLDEMRKVHPSAVPPPRPPRPQQSSWKCLKCSESNDSRLYRCCNCSFPRPAIDPRETRTCGCDECGQSPREQKVQFRNAEGGDWTIIERVDA
ncbi:hypothetical protein WR25_03451 [Diploscapter pachys]|uniref:RanBP2-type domain-containing protein n=1 Tax=Diploscapter pachys TaxID=2018661 RepID=A0A2A2J7J5_9BILA|nr:hypothetical protein WR25_03451 [Diploscapter pachys]